MPGDEIELSRETVVSVVQTQHSISSVGYIVWNRRKKLKPEYQSLTQDEIRVLAISGKEVSCEVRSARLAYVGDSTIEGIDANPAMYEADILITEMSFVAQRHRSEKIKRRGHIHLDDIVARKDRFKNGRIIVSHFSTRCTDKEIKHIVRKRLPDMLDGRLVLWF
jgi:ribonuclease Z